jgi:hypothetical protein
MQNKIHKGAVSRDELLKRSYLIVNKSKLVKKLDCFYFQFRSLDLF